MMLPTAGSSSNDVGTADVGLVGDDAEIAGATNHAEVSSDVSPELRRSERPHRAPERWGYS